MNRHTRICHFGVVVIIVVEIAGRFHFVVVVAVVDIPPPGTLPGPQHKKRS